MRTKELVLTALFSAVISVLSLVSVPTPLGIPLTIQVFAVALCGFTLGTKMSVPATVVYILLGLIGLPIFSGFTGGISVLFGLTGGFIIGFIPLSLLTGLNLKSGVLRVVIGMLGLVICHIIGIVQFSVIAEAEITSSFIVVSAPYLVKDIVLVIGAFVMSKWLRKAIYKSVNAE